MSLVMLVLLASPQLERAPIAAASSSVPRGAGHAMAHSHRIRHTAPVVASVSIDIGWNLISLPVQSGISSASGLIASLTSKLGAGTISEVAIFTGGHYHLFVPGFSTELPLQAAQGIFVHSSTAGTWSPSGTAYTSPQPVYLQTGWNLVAAPFPSSGIDAALIASQIGTCVTEIATYAGGSYHTWVPSGPAMSVQSTSGMWIYCTAATPWSPMPAPPPDPASVAPPIDQTVSTDVSTSTEFLYTGSDPIQTGVAPGTIDPVQTAVIRGRVLDRAGNPISGAMINVLSHPEFGQTESRDDGRFDLAVNGGGLLTVSYARNGYLPAQRQIQAPWQNYADLPDVVLIPEDTHATAVDLSASDNAIQVAQGSSQTDSSGTRQATLLFQPGTTATMTMPDGSVQPVSSAHVRATEFTVGATGPDAMPGELPPTSGYTYAADFTLDEAQAVGATNVQFSKPVYTYVQNFLHFAAGTPVPVGFYDRTQGKWVASQNGLVITILSRTNGMANLDVDGSGTAGTSAAYAGLGITDAERTQLANLYADGTSLWRVPITHFSSWDCNWPFGPPPGAAPPDGPGPSGGPNPGPNGGPNDCPQGGSVIGCQNQTLGEDIPIRGTPFSLHYQSERSAGRKDSSTLHIPLSGTTMPPGVQSIQLTVAVAGKLFSQSFSAALNQSYTFSWDGKDSYGRTTQGQQAAIVRVGYVYNGLYFPPGTALQSFGLPSTTQASPDFSRLQIVLWAQYDEELAAPNARDIDGMGGWQFSPQNNYDPTARVLLLGDGSHRGGSGLLDLISMSTAAGNSVDTPFGPTGNFSGDGGPAINAQLWNPFGVATGPDGSIYIADTTNYRIRRVDPNGVITTVAGDGSPQCNTGPGICFGGDGGPATQAHLYLPRSVAVGPDGSLYIADTNNFRIRRVSPQGNITTVAGNGVQCSTVPNCGDGGPGTDASLESAPLSVAVAADGSVYIGETGRVRRLGTDGMITTFAGGRSGCPTAINFEGDGCSAATAKLFGAARVAVGQDGLVYISDAGANEVRRVGTDGIISLFAGGGPGCTNGTPCPATQAALNVPEGIAVSADGTVFIGDNSNVIRAVGPDGIISTIAGNGTNCDSYAPPTTTCGENGPATAASLTEPAGLAVGPDGAIYVADRFSNRIRKISPTLPGFNVSQNIIPSATGSELYVFDSNDRHVRTLDALTGAVRYTFGYNAAGLLTSVTDGDGNVTTIQRDASGNPTAIVAPGGQQTTLTVDANGYLATVADGAGDTYHLASTADGLLTSFNEPTGTLHAFTYDSLGRLTSDQNPQTTTTLVRTDDPNSQNYSIAITRGASHTTTYAVAYLAGGSQQLTVTDPSGGKTTSIQGTDGSQTVTYADGSSATLVQGPDPRWGMAAPIAQSITYTTPGAKTSTQTETRTATLSDPSNPLSLQSLSDTTTVNGQSTTTTYTGPTRTVTVTSPAGRVSTYTFNPHGHVSSVIRASGLTPMTLDYDALGRVTSVSQGTQSVTYAYDAASRLASRTDASGNTVAYGYDSADRMTSETLPGGAVYHVAYDADGNQTSVTMPNGAVHALAYTSTNDPSSYAPPGNAAYTTVYNSDGSPISTTLPGGRTETHTYDGGGRPTGMSYPEANTSWSYTGNSDQITGLSHTAGGGTPETLGYSYDGGLVTQLAVGGTATAQYSYTYDSSFRLSHMTLASGADTIDTAITRDVDGLLTGFGPFTVSRGGPGGAASNIEDGTMNTAFTFDSLGREASRTQTVNGTQTYREQFSYGLDGAISQKIETIGGVSHTSVYTYDGSGRLTGVAVDGTQSEAYGYDANGNRTSRQIGTDPASTAVYDAQDRLEAIGGTSYTVDSDGYLAQRGSDTFQYSTHGELLSATVGGASVSYAYDGLGRRVGRTDSSGTTQYLYGDPGNPLQLTGVRNPAGVLTTLYYQHNGLLYAMKSGSTWYYIAVDQVGTPRVVTDATGAVQKVVTYDSFGAVLTDSAPAFALPVGFAGGISDPLTGLVHFQYRDYDPAAGRWTARDPSLYQGSQANLYAYAGNNPVVFRDPTGLFCIGGSAYDGVGGGGQFCLDSKGVSVCTELGFGLGDELTGSLSGGPASNYFGIEGQASVGVGPLATLQITDGYNALAPCGKELTAAVGGTVLFNDFTTQPTLASNGLKTSSGNPTANPKVGLEGKVAVKLCQAANW
jgi:RHS repeat-associated protein